MSSTKSTTKTIGSLCRSKMEACIHRESGVPWSLASTGGKIEIVGDIQIECHRRLFTLRLGAS